MNRISTSFVVMIFGLMAGFSLLSCSSTPVDKYLGYQKELVKGGTIDRTEYDKFIEENQDYPLTEADKQQVIDFVKDNIDKAYEAYEAAKTIGSMFGEDSQKQSLEDFTNEIVDKVQDRIDKCETLGELTQQLYVIF